MANIVPGALWRPIDVGNRAARRKGRGLIGHIAVVNSTLLIPGPLSTRPSDWHFYLPKNPYPTGERFAQLIDLDLQSWSSAAGNATCPSFESEGGVGADVNGPWTPNQVESAAIILAHLHRTEGVPLQDMRNSLPTSRGFGIHRYGIDPYRVAGGEKWSSVYAKACPGDTRARQVPQIVARAQQIVNGTGGFLMALSDAQQQEIYTWMRGSNPDIDTLTVLYRMLGDLPRAVWNDVFVTRGGEGQVPVIQELADAKTQAIASRAEASAYKEALASLAVGREVDPQAIGDIVNKAVADALKNNAVQVNVDVAGKGSAA